MIPEPGSAGTAEQSSGSGEIHVRTLTLLQLFDPMDPSPVTHKDLLPNVAEFIVSSGREIRAKNPTLAIHVDHRVTDDDVRATTVGIHAFFDSQAAVSRRALRQLFRRGRVSLVIALAVLGLSIVGGEALQATDSPLARAVGGTLEIGGWVAMWRPLEVFLYDWWPILADIRLFERLAKMEVRVVYDVGQ